MNSVRNKIPTQRAKNVTLIFTMLLGLTSSCGPKAASDLADAQGSSDGLRAGTWAKQLILASESAAAGIRSDGTIERLFIVKATKKGDQFSTTEQLCDISAAGSKTTKLTFPEAFKRALPERTITYTLGKSGTQSLLTSPAITEVIGARLDNPASDELPTRAADARAFDQDGDELPGVTVEVSASALFVSLSGKVYIVQRTILEESGVVTTPERIDGTIKWTIEQKVLGSDSTVLGAVSPKITPDLDQSRFSMVKVAEDATCQMILDARHQLFGK
ncbi:MAG: hypothetical protein FJ146_08510 [Deltaproteobacteria bacterium]|nr:hypothetical protein [Deltaproteobacteria bacterium]